MNKGGFSIIFKVVPVVLLLLAGVGCTSDISRSQDEISKKKQTQLSPQENGRALLQAFLDNNSRVFVSDLPDELQKQFGEKEFIGARKSIIETLGEPVSFSYLSTLENPAFIISLWKVRFSRKNNEGETISHEAVFRVISGEGKEKFQVVSFNFL